MEQKEARTKVCAECGTEFSLKHGRQKYCPDCLPVVRRRQTAERTRQWRMRIKPTVTTE